MTKPISERLAQRRQAVADRLRVHVQGRGGHGDVAVAAATLHVHPQTVRYRLAALREAFGDRKSVV